MTHFALQYISQDELDTRAAAGTLSVGEPWLIASESSLAVVTSPSEYIALVDAALSIRQTIECDTNPPYPAARVGTVLRVAVGGKIGGSGGVDVARNDLVVCIQDSLNEGTHELVGQNWMIIRSNSSLTQHSHADASSGGIIQHVNLGGLELDDHSQYFNETRGDARYARLSGLAGTGSTLVDGGSF